MTEPMSRAERIRASSRREFVASSGNSYLLVQPSPMVLIQCGISPLCFSPTNPDGTPRSQRQRAEAIGQELERLAQDIQQEYRLQNELFARCMLDPKYHPGGPQDCPQDAVTYQELEADAFEVFAELLGMAGLVNQEVAAAAVAQFRKNATGQDGQPGGPVVSGEAQPAPDGLSGGADSGPGDG